MHRLARAAAVAAAAAAAGCAAAPRLDASATPAVAAAARSEASSTPAAAVARRFDASSTPSVELRDVPFFPQKKFQCGPAALATILAYEGLDADPDSLAPAVYVKGLRGSLQAELLAATRRRGMIPYVLEPTADALFAEVESGKPVLVLENLALPRVPLWHYAVVVGFDAERGDVVLRSGKRRRHMEPLKRFLRHFGLGGHWAFVALAPDEPPPATATPDRYVRALAAAEPLLGAAAGAAYSSALAHWPHDPLVLFAAAGHDLSTARYADAVELYETLLGAEPHHAAARNNLANALAEQGCRREALRQAHAALADAPSESPLRAAIEDTVRTLEDGRAAAASAAEPSFCPR